MRALLPSIVWFFAMTLPLNDPSICTSLACTLALQFEPGAICS